MRRTAGIGLLLVTAIVAWTISADASIITPDTEVTHRLTPPPVEGSSDDFNDSALATEEQGTVTEETENAAIPEPTTIALMGFGMAGMALRKRFMA